MAPKKIIKAFLLLILIIAFAFAINYAWFSFPIISGYSAKNACSCAYIQGRNKESITKEELGSFPLSMSSITINSKDSSVTSAVLGLAKRKAIYRNGLGCTLVNELSENAIRSQHFSIAQEVFANDTTRWPTGDELAKRLVTNKNRNILDSALALAFHEVFNDKKVYTRAVLVVHKGAIVSEQYAQGYNKNSKFPGWSMAKSITGALIGILVGQGKLKVEKPAPVAAWQNPTDKRHSIRLEHLLQQTSGLDFEEKYSRFSNATNMLFNKADMAGYTASLPAKATPGSEFYYSSGNSNILSGIIRQAVATKDYHSFPYTFLFHKIGMHHTLLEPDASGTFVGSSYVYASARDYARFGLLYLNDGLWNGKRILPAGWVQKSTTPPPANKLKNYGYQFWLNGTDPKDASKKEFPAAPADLFYADGYGGQRLYIIPSLQLVVVRMGLNKFDEQHFLKILLQAFSRQAA